MSPAALTAALLGACSREAAMPASAASYVGRERCVSCHELEHRAWHGSHHDLAMQVADESTVLGDFADSTFEHFGVTSRFFRDGDRFMVRTDGADGTLADFPVAYVFGVSPLQQYLIRFHGGRLQALGICWDARPQQQGGQRWFHLYDERLEHDDPLHWTSRNQNWNYMCAHCHSTDLRKGYDVVSDSYSTRWSEIDVSCEACHGPGSHHQDWADAPVGQRPKAPHAGFETSLRTDAVWSFAAGAPTATRTGGSAPAVVTETCAPCHSRRSLLEEGNAPGALHDRIQLSLLEENLYHADGQIEDEVYVYGSFAQSKMFHAGVTCTDCHDPHTLRPYAPGNALCGRCHQPAVFDVPEHHHHPVGSAGASCTACHMPSRRYMVVDPRLDHSIRIPRPDLTVKFGTPDACANCHDGPAEGAAWAAAAIEAWRGPDRPLPAHWTDALAAGR
ncbi:MAG: cytochrome C, partial [Planctomycetes bacterium]|nr:cytochrome C [Planctomycetota bacterium]